MEIKIPAPEQASAERLVSDGCLTVDESMKFTGLCRSKLYEHLQQGRIPVVKVGRRTLIPTYSSDADTRRIRPAPSGG